MITFIIVIRIWFIYSQTEFTNLRLPHKYRGNIAQILLSLFIPFYVVYWIYTTYSYLNIISDNEDVDYYDHIMLCTVVGFFIPLVSYLMIYSKYRDIKQHELFSKDTHSGEIILGRNDIQKTINSFNYDFDNLLNLYKSNNLTKEELEERIKLLFNIYDQQEIESYILQEYNSKKIHAYTYDHYYELYNLIIHIPLYDQYDQELNWCKMKLNKLKEDGKNEFKNQ